MHKNKGKPYSLLHTHFDLSWQAIIYIKTSSYTILCARDSVVLSGRSISILWLDMALERVTYSWPEQTQGFASSGQHIIQTDLEPYLCSVQRLVVQGTAAA